MLNTVTCDYCNMVIEQNAHNSSVLWLSVDGQMWLLQHFVRLTAAAYKLCCKWTFIQFLSLILVYNCKILFVFAYMF